jgi:hypothetical protein
MAQMTEALERVQHGAVEGDLGQAQRGVDLFGGLTAQLQGAVTNMQVMTDTMGAELADQEEPVNPS